jgi:3'-5' exoribonuclease
MGQVSADAAADGARPTMLSLEALRAASPGKHVEGCAMVMRSEAATDRTGRIYVSLTLLGMDGGRIEALWWRFPYPVEHRPGVGQVCYFKGTVDAYNGERQLSVVAAHLAPEVDPAVFARSTRRSGDELWAELQARVAGLKDGIAALVRTALDGEVGERFRTWPASHQRHAAVRHGLLAHSLRVAGIAQLLGEAYGLDGLPHDRELVQAACLLHDIGKVHTLPAVSGATVSDEARLFDHVTLSVLMVKAAAAQAEPLIDQVRLGNLLHAIVAHHGRQEWGAPVEPQTVEAQLVHPASGIPSRPGPLDILQRG